MGYDLGVDLGTTYTAAAVHRNGTAQIVELGNRSATIPSVVFLTEHGELLTGEAANRRATTEPSRVAREFKRRTGDPTPLLLGGSPHSAESLSARLLEWVIGRVTELEGSAPDRIGVTHPANWGPYKLDLLHQAFRLAGLEDVVTLTEPEAAAIHYATLERVEVGSVIAVFDLGGGTFDAAILRKTESGFDFLGRPEGIERLGGIDFDEAVFGFVARSLGPEFAELDSSDPNVYSAVARLRREVVEAKEALSGDTDVAIPVMLPELSTTVRLTRTEFEQMIRPALTDTINTMNRAISGASLEPKDIDVVLLVGGSSRIPMVGQLVRSEIGRPIAVDAHPKHSIVLGAALAAAAGPQGAHLESVAPPVVAPPPVVTSPSVAPSAPSAPPSSPTPDPVVPLVSAASTSEALADTIADLDIPDVGVGGLDEQSHGHPVPGGVMVGESALARPAPSPSRGVNKNLIGAGSVAAILVVLFLVANSMGLLGGSDDTTEAQGTGDANETVESLATATTQALQASTTAAVETAAVPSSTSTDTVAPAGFSCNDYPELKCSKIESVRADGGEIVVDWSASYPNPDDNGGFHAHVYYNTYSAESVGTGWEANGAEQKGVWVATKQQPYRTQGPVSVANMPAEATEICVVTANEFHNSIDHDTANCVPIPDELVN